MEYIKRIFCVLVFLQVTSHVFSSDNDQYFNEATQIFNTVFHKYSTKVPPRKVYPEPIYLDIQVEPVHVHSVDAQINSMTLTFDLRLSWFDSRITWNAFRVGEVLVPLEDVWTPDLSIANAISKVEEISASNVVLQSNGTILWKRRFKADTYCAIFNSTNADCSIEILSDLLPSDVIAFKNVSKCSTDVTTHGRGIEAIGSSYSFDKIPSTLYVNATYDKFTCQLSLQTPEAVALTSSADKLSITLGTLLMFVALSSQLFAQR